MPDVSSVLDLPKSTGYRSAVAAYSTARKLDLLATIFIALSAVIAIAGAAAFVIALIEIDGTGHKAWIAASIAGGTLLWLCGALLVGFWAKTYAKDVQARAPWEPK
jgi:hypothetical protein